MRIPIEQPDPLRRQISYTNRKLQRSWRIEHLRMLSEAVCRAFVVPAIGVLCGLAALCQDQDQDAKQRRIFGVIPNNRTFTIHQDYKPITSREKFRIATQDSFDRGTVLLGAAFAGKSQLGDSNPSFGQGVKGYGHYFVTAYSDFVIGNYMTEAVYPTLLHQDPRYCRKAEGSGASRLAYAMRQIFWTRRDSGGHTVNWSELLGNSTAVAISNSYYPENRTAGEALSKLGIQIGLDMAGNVLKEFSPDLSRKLFHKHSKPRS